MTTNQNSERKCAVICGKVVSENRCGNLPPCELHAETPHSEEWEREFERIGEGRVRFIATRGEVKSFIHRLVQKERAEIALDSMRALEEGKRIGYEHGRDAERARIEKIIDAVEIKWAGKLLKPEIVEFYTAAVEETKRVIRAAIIKADTEV